MILKSNEEIKLIYEKFGLKMLNEYKGMGKKNTFVDNEGYKYSIELQYLDKRKNLNMSSGRYSNKNEYKVENIKHYMDINVKNGTKIIKVCDNLEREKLIFNCGYCKKNFEQQWKVFTRNNPFHCCQSCANKLKKSKQKDIGYIREYYKKYGYKLLENESHGTHMPYYVQDKEGYIGRLKLYSASKKNYGVEKFNVHNKYTFNNLDIYLKRNNIPLIVSQKNDIYYTDKPIIFICECGREFKTTLSALTRGKNRCNTCQHSMSNLEKVVYDYLAEININFINQYKITNYKGYSRLFYDFYLIEFGILLEIDGEQHERPIRFNGIPYEKAKECFIKSKERDKIKDQYCKEHNIPLYRINYDKVRNNEYKQFIKNITHQE